MNEKLIIETILLACPDSVSSKTIRKMLNSDLSDKKIESYIESLNNEYEIISNQEKINNNIQEVNELFSGDNGLIQLLHKDNIKKRHY